MPTYVFRYKDTGEEFTKFMTLSEREEFINEYGHAVEQVPSAPVVVSGIDRKPDGEFRNLLKEIKKKHPKGNINTF